MALSYDQTIALISLSRQIEWFYQLDSYTTAQLSQLLKAVSGAEADVLARIADSAANLPNWSEDRAIALLNNFNNLTVGVRSILENGIATMAAEAGAAGYIAFNDIVSFGGRVQNFNPVSLTAEQLQSILVDTPVGGKLLSDWVEGTYSNVAEDIQNEFIEGMLTGDSYPEFVSRLTEGFGMAKKDAISLSRTYVQSVNVEAQQQVYQANEDVVKKLRWTSTLETGYSKSGNGTCAACALLDGTEYSNDENTPPMPLHVRCRCLWLPIMVTWKELGFDMEEIEDAYRPYVLRPDQSIGEGGQRTIKEVGFEQGNYKDFYLKQNKTFQNNVLGPRRADLLSSGKAKWEDLVDRQTGKLILLKDLNSE